MRAKTHDYWSLYRQELSPEKIKEVQKLAKRANVRLLTMEKANKKSHSYKRVEIFLNKENRPRFYEGKKYDSNDTLNRQIMLLKDFLSSPDSTLTGMKKRGITAMENRFKEKGIDAKNTNKIYEFLHSSEWRTIKGRKDSSTLIEMYDIMLEKKYSTEEIENAFQDYLLTEITDEEVSKKWLNARKRGKLLK